MTRQLLVATLVLAAACAKPETAEQMQARMQTESAAAKTAIAARSTAFAVHLSANHVDSTVAMYTENATLMPPNMPAVTGRADIRAWMGRNPAPPNATYTLTTAEVVANGPLAVERGTFSFSMPAQGRTPAMTVTGKYLAHWHMVDGNWLMVDDIWNENAAMPAAPTAH